MKFSTYKTLLLELLIVVTPLADASENSIDIVGSSTVYPFAAVVAERFSQATGNPSPKIESTGSGGGMKLFCKGVGDDTADITNASRRMKKSEQTLCAENDVSEILEVKIGYGGIVIAQSLEGNPLSLTRKELFLALAKNIPDVEDNLIANPNKTWNDINPTFPTIAIKVYGPPPTSGTRDTFAELALEEGCQTYGNLKALKKSDKKRYKAICHGVREDGAYVESGENDNLIIQKLSSNPDTLGIFGFSFLEKNRDKVRGIKIEEKAPLFEAIADGSYPISRPLFFYVKMAHYGKTNNLRSFVEFFVQPEVIGEDGFLAERGLIPLPANEYATVNNAVFNNQSMAQL